MTAQREQERLLEALHDARAELARCQAALTRIVGTVPAGIIDIAADGVFNAVNPEARRILGLDEVVDSPHRIVDFAEATLRDDGTPCPVAEYPATGVLQTGRAQGPTTIGMQRADGAIVWGVFRAVPVLEEPSGALRGAIVTVVDITERRQAEEALRASEARLRSILESAPNPILTTDLDGRITQLNRTGVTGLTPERAIGISVLEFTHPDDQPRVAEALKRVLTAGTIEQYSARAAAGLGDRVFLVRVGPVVQQGIIVGATMVSWDLTDQQRLEEQLAVADRMASIGTLAAGMAHEINNPLSYMFLNLERVMTNLAEDRDRAEDVERLRLTLDGAMRIRDIVRALSTFAQGSGPGASRVDPVDVVESAIRLVHFEARTHVSLVRDLRPAPEVWANPSQLAQVFVQLLMNASNAVPADREAVGEVQVATGTTAQGEAYVEVVDHGAGVPEVIRDRIFEPFVTGWPPNQGQGLGLYVAHNIVRGLGGTIEYTRTGDQRTSFRVKLPAAGVHSGGDVPSRVASGPGRTPLKILIVDDEPAVRNSIAMVLDGHSVTEAKDGRDALERLAEADFDLILCDLVMPTMTGMDFYYAACGIRPQIADRLTFITGGAFTERVSQFIERERPRVLEKPIRTEELLALVDGFTGR